MTHSDTELREQLINWRCRLAELLQDRHSHGVTTEQLKKFDTELAEFITAKLTEARIEGATTPVVNYNMTTAIAVKAMCEERIAALRSQETQQHKPFPEASDFGPTYKAGKFRKGSKWDSIKGGQEAQQ